MYRKAAAYAGETTAWLGAGQLEGGAGETHVDSVCRERFQLPAVHAQGGPVAKCARTQMHLDYSQFAIIIALFVLKNKATTGIRQRTRKDRIMQISARNQLKGTVSSVKDGAVNGIVTIDLGDAPISADITMESIKDLGLAEGKSAIAIIKSTNVMFAAGDQRIAGISARNQLVGTVTTIRKGAVNGHVGLELADGSVITGSITNSAIEDLGLEVGKPAVAIVKSTDVIVGVE